MLKTPLAAHLISGQVGETVAAIYLQQKGLKLVQKNYKTTHGEIDLIMRDGNTLVFVEVRLRKSQQFGGAAMSITPSKQQKLQRTAAAYLQQHGDCQCRFDAILMQSANLNAVEWLQNII